MTALVTELVTPLIAAIGGKPDFSASRSRSTAARSATAHFINALIAFVTIAAVVFFFVLKPVNALMARRKVDTPTDETTRACPECISDIPIKATRCAFCSAQVGPSHSAKPGSSRRRP